MLLEYAEGFAQGHSCADRAEARSKDRRVTGRRTQTHPSSQPAQIVIDASPSGVTKERSQSYQRPLQAKRVQTIAQTTAPTPKRSNRATSAPRFGRLRVVVRQLVSVLRHRQHPHGAERGNHRDIHDDPHGPIPPVHTVRELRLLARSSGREQKSCGCGFQATKARVRFVRRAYPPCQRHRDAGVALARARTPP